MKINVKGINFERKLKNWAEEIIKEIQGEMKMQNLNASGNLSNSLSYSIAPNAVTIYGNYYFPYAVGGRKAGKAPSNFNDILLKWIEDKGLSKGNDKENLKFASSIAWKIRLYGSAKHRGDKPKNDVLYAPMLKMMPKLDRIIENELVVYINDVVF